MLFYYSGYNNIGDEGMKYLFDASKNWTQLTGLDLSNYVILLFRH